MGRVMRQPLLTSLAFSMVSITGVAAQGGSRRASPEELLLFSETGGGQKKDLAFKMASPKENINRSLLKPNYVCNTLL